ncbi:phenylalanine--tRNA ligase subunit beta [Dysosmobacter sp.]|uniref:phenylalanine--tRNA ligase subunit beta n=1 Tax=Dysosmobacter sp. TaxID=2591382 RepID=UPI002A92E459|nr:phenylalanine--tRNA ligase subunit beta [Dysosmobacter sp.]MCI6054275.1 phenylalanine--tRNA ligase subunit beta [Dysosmobacter sp.]MDY5508830.1 phenylalanine--tRNA ligase subunit beta [Dysosmobacter sp.]
MLLSRKWLSEFVDVDANDKEFAEAMTLSGSKVEVTEDLGAEISNVVVGRVLSMERHPDSDHMWVCQVDVAQDQPVQIVTGAWNVHVGDLVPVALHKSTLPGGKKIEKGKLRGVESNGMLCGLYELGLDERDFPYAAIIPAALLNDYKPLDPAKPSIPADVQPGHKIYGPVVAAGVKEVIPHQNGWTVTLDLGGGHIAPHDTALPNIHAGDMVAYNTDKALICTLADLHAQQAEFPHCIPDGIFILREDCKPGDDLKPVINADDHVVEFEITPNRPDCLSVIGLAREAAATFDKPLRLHEPVVKGGAEGVLTDLLDVETPDADLCPRYTARMVRNVKIAPSPKWMRERLRSMGVRPINNIVDITNYVMLEYGQPMHAFDYRYVKGGKIIVRRAADGEELTTLDGNVRKLTGNMLVIADETRAVGLAGVMGGENSEIVADTADVVFESACFDGTCIRKTALALGMRTEASAKFEKGLDPLNTLPAVNRACELVELLGAGEVVDGIIDVLNFVPQPRVLKLEPEKINGLLGTDVEKDEMVRILRKLDFTVEGDQVTVPSWRGDVEGMADLAEEVARFHGYNNIPVTLMRGQTTLGGFGAEELLERRCGAVCRAMGYDEIITYSFISPTQYDKILWPADYARRESFKILNPLGEDTSIMRTTTLPSMLEILTRNYNYRNQDVKLYEVGRVYLPGGEDGLADERKVLTLGAYGGDMDFYAMKGTIEAILKDLRVDEIRFQGPTGAPSDASYHPGRCATVWAGSSCIGIFGQIHPLAARNYGVDTEFYCAELSLDQLGQAQGPDPEYVPLPKFPAVERDIAVVCDKAVTVGALEDCIRKGAKGLLKDVALFDIYTGAGIPEGKKSVAFSLTLRADDRSLTSEEADADVKSILETLEKDLGAVLR